MRRAAKIDENQPDIVLALVAQGWIVQSLAAVGVGCPDLLVGAAGINVLLEIKDMDQPPCKRRLNDYQEIWHRRWKGQVATVETAEDAITAVLTEIGRHCLDARRARCDDEPKR